MADTIRREMYGVAVPDSKRIAISETELQDLRAARRMLDWLLRENRHLFGILSGLRGKTEGQVRRELQRRMLLESPLEE